jgi:hypothetical protein
VQSTAGGLLAVREKVALRSELEELETHVEDPCLPRGARRNPFTYTVAWYEGLRTG